LLSQPHSQKPEAHDDSDVKDGQHSKGIAEWTMDNVPKMKDALRLIEEDNPLG
jgi:hypothetical protein